MFLGILTQLSTTVSAQYCSAHVHSRIFCVQFKVCNPEGFRELYLRKSVTQKAPHNFVVV